MKVVSAYLLAVVGGNQSPSADDVTAILSSVGIELQGEEQAQLDSLIAEMEGKDPSEVMAAGFEKISKIPGGGASGGAAAAGPAAGGDEAAAPEEAKKKSSSSEEVAGAGGMFEDDY